MTDFPKTRWTMVHGAAQGNASDQDEFVACYENIVRSYLAGRWRGSLMIQHIDDGVQDVFLECFGTNSPLQRTQRNLSGGFRAFLHGVVRNIARRIETKQAAFGKNKLSGVNLAEVVTAREPRLSQMFDRAWAEMVLQRSAERQAAKASGDEKAARRVELLRLRFQCGLPIHEIARRWNVDSVPLHRE